MAADDEWRVRLTLESVVGASDREAAVRAARAQSGVKSAVRVVREQATRLTGEPDNPKAAALADALHEMWTAAGSPRVREIGDRIGHSHSAVHKAIHGQTVPQWHVLEAIVTDLGGAKRRGSLERWKFLWESAVLERKQTRGR